MKIRVIHFGKIKNKDIEALISYYKGLSTKYFDLEILQLKDSPEQKISQELISNHLSDETILLDELGKEYNSKEFSNLVFNKQVNAQDLTFIVGNAFGFVDELKTKFKTLALSKFTLPHELALVILFEQIYRAGGILNNSKYHK